MDRTQTLPRGTENRTLVAADLESALAASDWRRRVSWPVSTAEASRIGTAQLRRAFAFLETLDDPLDRDATLLALPNIAAYARSIVTAALAASRVAARGARLVGSAPEFGYLRDGGNLPPGRGDPVLAPASIRFGLARRLARTQDWTGFRRLLPAMIAPSAVAVSHNPLLRQAARQSAAPVGFFHAETLLDAARRRHPGQESVSPETAPNLAIALVGTDVDSSEFAERALALVEATAHPHLRRAANDVAALRNARLPDEIWSGSGGSHAPRAVGIELMRRGGRVIRFDHGMPRGFMKSEEAAHLVEFSVSSDYCVTTDAAARLCRAQTDDPRSSLRSGIEVRGLDGDPTFLSPPPRRVSSKSGQPRVVYAPTQLLGFRQLLPAQPVDVIYLDWQLRVAEALSRLPVQLICQPHPEGLLAGRPHPLETVVTTIRGRFSAQLGVADVFVFDYPSTTALWQAACTDARIVFLDIGAGEFAAPVRRLVEERATVIDVASDEDNRPILDDDALRDSVMATGPAGDPGPLRQILLGRLA